MVRIGVRVVVKDSARESIMVNTSQTPNQPNQTVENGRCSER